MKEYLFLLVSSAILLQQCDTTETIVPEPVKDPREYNWTIDSLFYPGALQILMGSIWGSSSDNIYVAGDCDDAKSQIWHYNGNQWNAVHIYMGVAYSPASIYGFSAKDIWIAGGFYGTTSTLDSSLIMHYDGSSWKKINAYGGRLIENIWGNSSDNVWFVGLNGTIFHWNGTSLQPDSLPFHISKDVDPFYNMSVSGNSSGDTYFLVNAPSGKVYLFKRMQDIWSVVDSNLWGWQRMNVRIGSTGNIYESGAAGYYKWTGSNWENLLDQFDGYTFGIEALSEENIFITGWIYSTPGNIKSLLYHYNGQDFFLYEDLMLDDVSLFDAWSNGNEVFVVGYTHSFPQISVVLHGK